MSRPALSVRKLVPYSSLTVASLWRLIQAMAFSPVATAVVEIVESITADVAPVIEVKMS